MKFMTFMIFLLSFGGETGKFYNMLLANVLSDSWVSEMDRLAFLSPNNVCFFYSWSI